MINAVRQPVVKYVDRESVVSPRTDLDGAGLLVKREELDVDRTQAEIDRRRLPDYVTVRMYRHLRHRLHGEVTVSAIDVQYAQQMPVCKCVCYDHKYTP